MKTREQKLQAAIDAAFKALPPVSETTPDVYRVPLFGEHLEVTFVKRTQYVEILCADAPPATVDVWRLQEVRAVGRPVHPDEVSTPYPPRERDYTGSWAFSDTQAMANTRPTPETCAANALRWLDDNAGDHCAAIDDLNGTFTVGAFLAELVRRPGKGLVSIHREDLTGSNVVINYEAPKYEPVQNYLLARLVNGVRMVRLPRGADYELITRVRE